MEVLIIGGGLSGLISSILLSRAGWKVKLIEKKDYPFHRVCGEYISNEVIPFLKSHDLFPENLNPIAITQLQLSDTAGNTTSMKLDLGGFGISRYAFDHWLAQKALQAGVEIQTNEQVQNVQFTNNAFEVTTSKNEYSAPYVIGTFGKRSNMDRQLNRPFFKKKSPYIGVKYHIKNDSLDNRYISLHNFQGGYCGVSQVENGHYNVCYLSERKNLKKADDITHMEQTVLFKNPQLKSLFEKSHFVFEKPVVINEISFAPKEPVFQHMLMSGDAAGMITPLCGNGMAMAIHGAKMLVEHLIEHQSHKTTRADLEMSYTQAWKATFQTRHWTGRQIQSGLFGTPFASNLAIRISENIPFISRWLMKQTHGQPF